MRTRRTALAACVVWLVSVPAGAIPMASLDYLETELGGGLFQYEYTLGNLGDPVADAGFDAYDMFLAFAPGVSLVSATTPAGWDIIFGAGFLDAFSLLPGAAPVGTDVGPRQSLAGFTFVFDDRVGSLPFQVVFTNPLDPANPVTYDGVSTPLRVQEPSALLLLGAGLAAAVLERRRRRQAPSRQRSTQRADAIRAAELKHTPRR
jgi:hypothetical protein